MRCPNCGYPRAKYDVSRKHLWRKHKAETDRKGEPRTNWNAHCPKCGYKWDDSPVEEESLDILSQETET